MSGRVERGAERERESEARGRVNWGRVTTSARITDAIFPMCLEESEGSTERKL